MTTSQTCERSLDQDSHAGRGYTITACRVYYKGLLCPIACLESDDVGVSAGFQQSDLLAEVGAVLVLVKDFDGYRLARGPHSLEHLLATRLPALLSLQYSFVEEGVD